MVAKRPPKKKAKPAKPVASPSRAARPSALLDTRIIYCGDCLDQLAKLPGGCVDLIYIDPPFNSNRKYEVFWGEGREKRAFEDRHASTQAYIDTMRPRCQRLARVLKPTGSFYYTTATGTLATHRLSHPTCFLLRTLRCCGCGKRGMNPQTGGKRDETC